jgi:glycosyltransferase involved in cell wall biosynthesis
MKISIITINLNNAVGLKKTILSVLCQTFRDFEFIIVDGGSTDGSYEIISQHDTSLSSWVSEPDNGIYNAMNKGIALAKADYMLFLNSGDSLVNEGVLTEVASRLGVADIVYGNLRIGHKGAYHDHVYPNRLTFSYFLGYSIGHPATFIKRALFEKVGMYDESMLICADWAFFIRAIGLFKASYQHIELTVAVFHTDGISCLDENRQIMREEQATVLRNEFSFFETDYESYRDLKDNIEALRRSKPYKFLRFLGLPKYQT